MKKLLKTYGTSLTVGLFFISTLSGVFLFFHISSATFHAMHEWLSMVLLVPVGFHIWRNWGAFAAYFKRKPIYIALVLSLIASLAFAYPSLTSTGSQGNPMRMAVSALHKGNIVQVAPLFDLSPDQLKQRLSAKGYVIDDLTLPLQEIAKKSHKPLGPSLIKDLGTN